MPQLRAVRQQSIFDLSPTAFTREEVEMQNLRLFLRAPAYQCIVNESPESLLQSLRNPRTLPFEAIKAAKSDRERVAPLLIRELQKFAADFQSYDRSDILPVIAIYLLAEWEVAESFETVLGCFALDDKYGGYELGDLITESGPVILAALCRADLDALERFTERKDISGWARGAAFKAMVSLVLWDKVPRDNVVTRFAWLFRRKPFARGDGITWTQLVDAAFELHPAELMDEIRPLFRQGIVDPFATTLEEFEREAKRDRATSLRHHADRFRPITDTAQSISYWGRWKESSPYTIPRPRTLLQNQQHHPSRLPPQGRKSAGMSPAPAEAERNTRNVAVVCHNEAHGSRCRVFGASVDDRDCMP